MTKLEKVIAGLQRCCVDNCTEGSKCPYYREKDCLTTLLYEALELLKERRWISVNDRLPTGEDIHFLVYKSNGIMEVGFFSHNGKRTHWGKGRCLITHWMPLPEPPTQEAQKEGDSE